MNFDFYKYSSNGNDFILIEGEPFFPQSPDWQEICHRRFGVGADGILFMAPSTRADFKMIYLNADGAQVNMCGNGARALARHYHLKHPTQKNISFETDNSLYHASISAEGEVCLEMNEFYDQATIDLTTLALPSAVQGRFYANTGVPHLVLDWKEDIAQVDLLSFAPALRYDSRFTQGVNVNICFRLDEKNIVMRTYERGVEDETYACGTGAMAVAHYFWQQGLGQELTLHTKGGTLKALREKDKFILMGKSQQIYFATFSGR